MGVRKICINCPKTKPAKNAIKSRPTMMSVVV